MPSSDGERFDGVSVVVPVFNEAESLEAVHSGLSAALSSMGAAYEIVFVNDGSTDATPEILRDLWTRDDHVTALYLARNFGHLAARTAGLAEARGSVVVTMDGDGQMDPADIPALVDAVRQGAEVSTGRREHRQDRPFRKLMSRIANHNLRTLGGLTVRDYGCSLQAYRAEFLDCLELGPHRIYDKASAYTLAGNIVELPVGHRGRKGSRWRTPALARYGLSNLVTFGEELFVRVGVWAVAGGLAGLVLLGLAIAGVGLSFLAVPVVVLACAWLTGMLAMVGFAASRAVREISGRPYYLIRETLPARRREVGPE